MAETGMRDQAPVCFYFFQCAEGVEHLVRQRQRRKPPQRRVSINAMSSGASLQALCAKAECQDMQRVNSGDTPSTNVGDDMSIRSTSDAAVGASAPGARLSAPPRLSTSSLVPVGHSSSFIPRMLRRRSSCASSTTDVTSSLTSLSRRSSCASSTGGSLLSRSLTGRRSQCSVQSEGPVNPTIVSTFTAEELARPVTSVISRLASHELVATQDGAARLSAEDKHRRKDMGRSKTVDASPAPRISVTSLASDRLPIARFSQSSQDRLPIARFSQSSQEDNNPIMSMMDASSPSVRHSPSVGSRTCTVTPSSRASRSTRDTKASTAKPWKRLSSAAKAPFLKASKTANSLETAMGRLEDRLDGLGI